MQLNHMRRVLSELRSLLDREFDEIRRRNFGALSAIVRRKEELVSVCDDVFTRLSFEPQSQSIVKELEAVQRKAERNAAELLAIKRGVIDAKARIDAILRNEAKIGLYGQDGGKIRARAAASLRRDV